EQDAGGGTATRGRTPDPQRKIAFAPFRKRGGQDGQGCGREQRRSQSLESTEADQRALGPGQAVEKRADGEEDEPCDENAPTPEQVGEPTAEQQHAAEEDGVRGDDPLQALLAEVEVGLDRREGDVHDRHVEDDHELGGNDQGQGKPSSSVLEGRHTTLQSRKPNTNRFPSFYASGIYVTRAESKLRAYVNAIYCTMVFVDTLVSGARD